MTSFRDRCRAMVDQLARNGMLRQSSPVDDLMAFVQSEIGRTADHGIEAAQSLILYFPTEADREKFMIAFREVNPTWMTKKIP